MNDKILGLLATLKTGNGNDLEAFVRAVGESERIDAAWLTELCEAAEPLVRQAACRCVQNRPEPALLEVVARLVGDRDDDVRAALANLAGLATTWDWRLVDRLLRDEYSEVRRAASSAACRYPELLDELLRRLQQDDSWTVRQTIAQALAEVRYESTRTFRALLESLTTDTDSDVWTAAAKSLERQFELAGGSPDAPIPSVSWFRIGRERTVQIAGHVLQLRAWLDSGYNTTVDIEQIQAYGTVLSEPARLAKLPRAYGADDAVLALLRVFEGPPPRAAILLGPSGSGKTAVVHELVHCLASGRGESWHVLRVAPAEFLKETKWLGEWQTRLAALIEAIRAPRKCVLYIPNVEELAGVGRSSSSDSNVATALAPLIERGDVMVVAETTEEAFKATLGADFSLRRLFQIIKLPEAGLARTRRLLEQLAAEAGVPIEDGVLDRLLELSEFLAARAALPGRAIDLFRQATSLVEGAGRPLADRDVLAVLRQSTGVPTDMLDDSIRLERAKIRDFFEARVMGQPEAVDAAVDLVMLIKAALTDPDKPLGVLLFVGPTGVGKTELARSLAEFCFGDPARLVRLDMSEYATYEAYERLTGKFGYPGQLTTIIREQPFSIVLLDEIEKAHYNVYDLCLQMFDAGRLTDGLGKTADFRRSIIILTSNAGSSLPQGAPIGFGPPGDLAPQVSTEAQRALSRLFRPEFLNRIDRVIHFRPLAEETARRIAERELGRVLERSGVTRRKLVVDVDPSVLPLLLREGYSPTFGARPLKRAVERLVLLPLAQAIAAGEVRRGYAIRLSAANSRIRLHATSLDDGEAEEPKHSARPRPPVGRVDKLLERIQRSRDLSAAISLEKSNLLVRAASEGFWEDAQEARQVYERIYNYDGILSRIEKLVGFGARLSESLNRHHRTSRLGPRLLEKLDHLEARATHVEQLLAEPQSRLLADALVTITAISTRGTALAAVEKLALMYRKFALRHELSAEVLDDHRTSEPREDTISLHVGGVGAYALLCGEAGLHQFARSSGQRSGGDREVVRVEVAPHESAELRKEDLRLEVRPLKKAKGRLLRQPLWDVHLMHVPTQTGWHAWTDGEQRQILERIGPLLHARVSAASGERTPAKKSELVVRKYRFGPNALVHDVRTAQKSGRLDSVLAGHLDGFVRIDQPAAIEAD